MSECNHGNFTVWEIAGRCNNCKSIFDITKFFGSVIDETNKENASLKQRVSELEEALKEIENLPWGWDGDCGAQNIINRVFD
jgi:hypothetical protein